MTIPDIKNLTPNKIKDLSKDVLQKIENNFKKYDNFDREMFIDNFQIANIDRMNDLKKSVEKIARAREKSKSKPKKSKKSKPKKSKKSKPKKSKTK